MTRGTRERAQISIAFLGFVLIGVNAGGQGVLLPEEITFFGLDKAGVGPLFVLFSAGYVTSAMLNGRLVHRFGARAYLASGAALLMVAAAGQAMRPPFVIFVGLQLVLGYGTGAIDAGLNAYLSTMAGPTPLLNSLHAFFGVGAILGPILAAAMISSWGLPWNLFLGLVALIAAPVVVGVLVLYPRAALAEEGPRPSMASALRLRAVVLGSAFLAVYVGLEVGLGNWGFTFLREDRGQPPLLAGAVMSGYWTGLMLGRFVLARLVERFGLGARGLNAVCLAGVALGSAAAWAVPSSAVATAGFVVIGFFLGPLFPTMISAMPALTPPRLVATAIGVLVGMSAVGGAIAPWIAGLVGQRFGAWSLLPFSLGLTAGLALLWWRIATRLAQARTADVAGAGDIAEAVAT